VKDRFEAGIRMFRYHNGAKQEKELFHAIEKQPEPNFAVRLCDVAVCAEIFNGFSQNALKPSLV
jgi:hypothetical protein